MAKSAASARRRRNPVATPQSDAARIIDAAFALVATEGWRELSLAAADISTGGVRGAVAVKLTAAAYLSTMRTWQGDDSPDLARTMAALDARLRRIERWLAPLHRPRRNGEPLSA